MCVRCCHSLEYIDPGNTPYATVRAATLNDMAVVLRGAGLPVIEGDIGDSWIYGVATDPKKTSVFRHILLSEVSFEGKDLNNQREIPIFDPKKRTITEVSYA